jgi:Dolichyl-phosphate-mannose-protein mannosyltransferase
VTHVYGMAACLSEMVGLGWAVGMALFTSVYVALYFVGMPCDAAMAPALAVAVAGITGGLYKLYSIRRTVFTTHRDSPLVTVAGLSIVVVQMSITVWMALHSLLRYSDAWNVWGYKARMFALNGPPAVYFHSEAFPSHPDYPLNFPLAEAAFFRLPDPLGLRLAAIVSPACLGALILLLYAGLTRLYGSTVAALGVATLLLVPYVLRIASYGYADVPVALYMGAAALYLLLWWRLHQVADLLLMGLLAGGAVWTKKEGVLAALVLLFACVIGEVVRGYAPLRSRVLHLLGVGIAAVGLPLPWLIFTQTAHPVSSDFLPVTLAVFVTNAPHLLRILYLFVQQTVVLERWSFFWVSLAVLVLFAGLRISRCGRVLVMLLSAQLGLYLLAYLFSSWSSYEVHIRTSLSRLMLQATPLALLVIVEVVHSLVPRVDSPEV